MINYYEKKDANTLVESIPMHKLQSSPEIIFGTKSCVEVAGVDIKFSICLPDKDTAQGVINAANNFIKCRYQDDLTSATSIDGKTMAKVLKDSCLGLDIQINEGDFKSKNEANAYYEMAMKKAMMKAANIIFKKPVSNYTKNKNGLDIAFDIPV